MSPTPDPAAILARLEELHATIVKTRAKIHDENLSHLWKQQYDALARQVALMLPDLIPLVRRAVELEGENARLQRRVDATRAERDKLQAFKDWCHSYLDGKGVPHHPPGTHGAEGCRIGDRMDYVFAMIEAAAEFLEHDDRNSVVELRSRLLAAIRAKPETTPPPG